MEVPLIALIAPICRTDGAAGAVCACEGGKGGADAAASGAPTALTAKKLDKIVAGKIIFREIVFRKSVAPEIVGRMDVLISLIRPFY